MPLLTRTAVLLLSVAAWTSGATIQMNDGRTLTGEIGKTSSVALDPNRPKPQAGGVRVERIVIVDDGLRRTYVSQNNLRAIIEDQAEPPIKVRVWQNVAQRGAVIGRVGQQVGVTPFDQFGRRVYTMQGPEGRLSVIQGVTEVTPVYTRVRGLMAEPRNYVWDMRIATSSIPRDKLAAIIATATPEGDMDARLQVVRLYLQSERYRDAQRELEAILADHPEMDDLRDELRQLRQLGARTILDEIELRRSAGQHRLVRALLERFPSEGVAGVTLERVRELLDELRQKDAEREKVLRLIDRAFAGLNDDGAKRVAKEVRGEIAAELNEASIARMASFVRLADDEGVAAGQGITDQQKAALAVSGWLVGANRATDNLAVAVSLFDVRAKVLAYLRSEKPEERQALLNEIREMEGGGVDRVAQLLRLMKPPKPTSDDALRGPGFYELSTTAGDEPVRYLVQLPPEYDPLRQYPAIVTLPGIGYLPERMIDFWAGAPAPLAADGSPGPRRGQAMRRGFITIAVDWVKPKQFKYDYSSREHAAVLASLRDAQRRFAIDTDRVFLTGHDAGGDAAWDLGVAHPDHWAGVVPFLARAAKYVKFYTENAKLVPWYFVAGEMDGGKMAINAAELDPYLKNAGYNTTIAEFLGRGVEPFNDEIQRLFDWMGRHERGPAPTEFAVDTMRPWDNYFWWLECDELTPRAMVHPLLWTGSKPPGRARAATLQGRGYQDNKLGAKVRAGRVTFWLSPDVIDFDKRIELEVNGRSVVDRDAPVKADVSVLLEDARTRADRQRPFWAKHVVE
ncbi:MAG: peptidase [Planctomycetota bacterium]